MYVFLSDLSVKFALCDGTAKTPLPRNTDTQLPDKPFYYSECHRQKSLCPHLIPGTGITNALYLESD